MGYSYVLHTRYGTLLDIAYLIVIYMVLLKLKISKKYQTSGRTWLMFSCEIVSTMFAYVCNDNGIMTDRISVGGPGEWSSASIN